MDDGIQQVEAWEGIRNGFESGRLAHAYILVGSPRGNALQFAESFLQLLFCEREEKPCGECNGCRQVAAHKHVDTLWIEPQSKSRQILADDIRALIQRMSQTSFEGGWKAGVILSADCMNVSSENALLKTLEEPPPQSLLLLLTDSPQALLPTINSRCQRIVLSDGRNDAADSLWHPALMGILSELPPTGGLAAARLGSRLKSVFDTVKGTIAEAVEEEFGAEEEALEESKVKDILLARTNARLKEVQAEVFRVILDWHRDLLLMVSNVESRHLIHANQLGELEEQAKLHTPASVLQAIQIIETMAQRLNRNIPDVQVFDEAFRKLIR